MPGTRCTFRRTTGSRLPRISWSPGCRRRSAPGSPVTCGLIPISWSTISRHSSTSWATRACIAIDALVGGRDAAIGGRLVRVLGVVLGEFLDPAGELECYSVGVLEVERPHVDTGMQGRRDLTFALV